MSNINQKRNKAKYKNIVYDSDLDYTSRENILSKINNNEITTKEELKKEIEYRKIVYDDKQPCGRVDLGLRKPQDRKNDFDPIEYSMSDEEAD